MRIPLRPLLFWACLLSGLQACNKPAFENIRTDVDLSAPIAKGTITEHKLFGYSSVEENLRTEPDGVIAVCDSTVDRLGDAGTLHRLFSFPDQTFSLSGLPPGPADASRTFSLHLDTGVRLDRMVFGRGRLSVSGTAAGSLTLAFPEITRNGETIRLAPGETLALDRNCVLTPLPDNRITVRLEGTLTSGGDLAVVLEEESPASVVGFFGRREISSVWTVLSLQPSIRDFFGGMETAYLRDPYFEFEITNTYDVPMLVRVDEMSIDGQPVPLKDELNSSCFLLEKGRRTIRLSNANTVGGNGFSDLITQDIAEVRYRLTTIANPDASDLPGTVPVRENAFGTNDFLESVSTCVLPIDGYFRNVVFQEYFDADLSKLNKEEYDYQSADYAFVAENGFPLDIEVQVYTLANRINPDAAEPLEGGRIVLPSAENNVPPDDPSLRPGIIDASNVRIVTLDKSSIDQLLSAQKILIKMTASTKGAQQKEMIRLYSGSRLKFELVMGARATVTLNSK